MLVCVSTGKNRSVKVCKLHGMILNHSNDEGPNDSYNFIILLILLMSLFQ